MQTFSGNSRIAISILIAITISLLTCYFVLNWLDSYAHVYKKQKNLYSEFLDSNKNRIFLLGSSHVGRLNATAIENYLVTNGKNYKVYNLAVAGDSRPINMIQSIDDIIDARPSLVVYGLAIRDFHSPKSVDVLNNKPVTKPEKSLPDPQNFFRDLFQPEKFVDGVEPFRNPQLVTLQGIENALENESFPVSDDVLLAVWNHMPKLQQNFPEVKQGNLDNLKKWARSEGWNETVQLYPLTPSGKTPLYLRNNQSISTGYKSNTPFFKYRSEMNSIFDNLTLKQLAEQNPQWRFDSNYNEENTITLREIISKLRDNNIRVMLFTTPQSRVYLDTIPPSDEQRFISILEDASSKYNVKLYHFQDKYKDLPIWHDPTHVSTNRTVTIYNDDIAKIILSELEH